MAKIQHDRDFECVQFKCPGCGLVHVMNVAKENRPRWQWNGSENRPTLTPSVKASREYGDSREKQVCHFFVKEGFIQFLNDCTHDFAGQTVEMRDIDQ